MRARLMAIPRDYQDGRDPYKAMAAQVLQKPLDEVTKEERQRAKLAFFNAFFVKAPQILTDLIQGDDDDN
jgi:hypothetical protein